MFAPLMRKLGITDTQEIQLAMVSDDQTRKAQQQNAGKPGVFVTKPVYVKPAEARIVRPVGPFTRTVAKPVLPDFRSDTCCPDMADFARNGMLH